MSNKQWTSIVLIIGWSIFSTCVLTIGLARAQEPDEEDNGRTIVETPSATPSLQPGTDENRATVEATSASPSVTLEAVSTQVPEKPLSPTLSLQPEANDTLLMEQTPASTSSLKLTGAGWIEMASPLTASDISDLALLPIDCAVVNPPVVGFEVSKGQDPNDITDFTNDLIANGFTVGSVDISVGPIPPCVDVLIVQGLAQNGFLNASYTTAEGDLLRNWGANGHGLMIMGDWGPFRAGVEALFQVYGYTQQGATAVDDSTDFDPAGPASSPHAWVIYQQLDNFASHPILSGVNTLQFLASSWLSPTTNTIVTTDPDAVPPGVSVMEAFGDGTGCVVLATDSNWVGVAGGGYFKQDNARVARQTVQWLSNCRSLNLIKTALSNPVQAGQLITYTLTASNDAVVPLTNVFITDTIPANTSFVSATLPNDGPDASGVISWSLATLNVNSSATVTMVVQIDSVALMGTLITNTAWVSSNEGLADMATTISLVSDQLVNPVIIKAVEPAQAQPGDVVTFTLFVQQEAGNSTAANVQIVDPLPDEVDIVSVQTTTGLAVAAGRVITWTIPLLGPIDIGIMTIRASVNANASPAPLTFTNQAVLSFDQGPDRLSNQVAIFVPVIDPPPPPPPLPPAAPKNDKRDSNGGDDDDDSEVTSAPAAITPIPTLALVATSVPTPVLPVLLLPETGSQARSGAGVGCFILGATILLAIVVILKFSSKRRAILNESGQQK